jgi:mannosyltransferase
MVSKTRVKKTTQAFPHGGRIMALGALAVIAAGVVLRLSIRLPTDLWQDEIIAATHAGQPFRDVVINVLRNDVHPPLYFLQLHLWGLLRQSDLWLMANSLVWSFAGILSLWWVARRHYGTRAALIAAAIYAILPAPMYLSDQVRMYAMLATLTIWAFHFATLIFKEGLATKTNTTALTALLIAIVFTHAIGSIAVATNGFYALHAAIARRRGLRTWFLVYGICAVCALPWLAKGMMQDANLHEGTGAYGAVLNLALTIAGMPASLDPVLFILGAACLVMTVGMGLAGQKTRDLTCYFMAFPILLSAAIGFILKPVFKWNFFSTIEAPFIALVLAIVFFDRRRWRAFLAAGCAIVLFCISVQERYSFRESSGYRYLAQLVRSNYKPGDIVYIPQQSDFWGMAWYLAGPAWGSPLKIAAPPSAQWRKVYSKLGRNTVAALGLMPETQLLDKNGFKLLTGAAPASQTAGAKRIWLVAVPGAGWPAGYLPKEVSGLPQQWRRDRDTWVTLYAAEPQHVTLPSE